MNRACASTLYSTRTPAIRPTGRFHVEHSHPAAPSARCSTWNAATGADRYNRGRISSARPDESPRSRALPGPCRPRPDLPRSGRSRRSPSRSWRRASANVGAAWPRTQRLPSPGSAATPSTGDASPTTRLAVASSAISRPKASMFAIGASGRRTRSPCTSILVSDRGERLICSFTDPTLDPDPGWLPLERVASFDVVLADVRWPRGSRPPARCGTCAWTARRSSTRTSRRPTSSRICRDAPPTSCSRRPALPSLAEDRPPGAALRRAALRSEPRCRGDARRRGLPVARRRRRTSSPALHRSSRSTRWRPATSGMARSRLRSPKASPSTGAAAFANTAAAIKCQRPGGRTGAPTRAEVEAALACTATVSPYTLSDAQPACERSPLADQAPADVARRSARTARRATTSSRSHSSVSTRVTAAKRSELKSSPAHSRSS